MNDPDITNPPDNTAGTLRSTPSHPESTVFPAGPALGHAHRPPSSASASSTLAPAPGDRPPPSCSGPPSPMLFPLPCARRSSSPSLSWSSSSASPPLPRFHAPMPPKIPNSSSSTRLPDSSSPLSPSRSHGKLSSRALYFLESSTSSSRLRCGNWRDFQRVPGSCSMTLQPEFTLSQSCSFSSAWVL